MDLSLEATPRPTQNKGQNRRTRKGGQIPAVVYGREHAPVSIFVDPVRLVTMFKETGDRNTVVQLKVGASSVPCLVREVQRHPLSREILHVDFYAVPTTDEVEVMVPVEPTGRPKGAQAGGRLRIIRRELKVACRYDRIPAKVLVDVSELDIGGFVKASQIPTAEGVRIVVDHDFNVVSVYGKRQDEGAPATPAGTPAEPAKES